MNVKFNICENTYRDHKFINFSLIFHHSETFCINRPYNDPNGGNGFLYLFFDFLCLKPECTTDLLNLEPSHHIFFLSLGELWRLLALGFVSLYCTRH